MNSAHSDFSNTNDQSAGTRPTVSVIVPAMNEAANLPLVAARFPTQGIDEVIVIDGFSTDDTVTVARQLWPESVIVQQTRKGKGNALACGFAAASSDIIVMIDADCSTDPAEIPDFVRALTDGADFAKGSRFCPGGGSADITTWRRFGNYGLNALVNVVFGAAFTDLCYGYNAFWRHCLPVMQLPDVAATTKQWGDGFEIETLINTRVARSGLKITEVSSFEEERRFGTSNLNSTRDGLRVLRTILDEKRSGPVVDAVSAAIASETEWQNSAAAREYLRARTDAHATEAGLEHVFQTTRLK